MISTRKMAASMANVFKGFEDEDLSVAHTNKQIRKVEEENVKIQEEICSLTAMIKAWHGRKRSRW